MAITWGNTELTGSANAEAVEIGATIPTATKVSGTVHHLRKILSVVKSTVENASDIVTFDGLVVAVDTSLSGTVTNDFVASNTVDAYGVISKIEEVTEKYTDAVASYNCTVDIFTKVV